MRNKKVVAMLLLVTMMVITGGCGSKQADQKVDVSVSDGIDAETDKTINAESSGNSIQEEIAQVEALEEENIKKGQACETQMDMNFNASERYQIWDDELNSLWSRLSEELDSSKKEEVLNEQREWIKKKDNAIKYAGLEAEGGSIQPLLEAEAGADYTKLRVYEFAKLLAEVRGEAFSIPEDVEADIQNNGSVDGILADFEGEHIVDEEAGTVLVIEKLADSDFSPSDFSAQAKWVIWYTHGDVLTDVDVIDYYPGTVIFKKGDSFYSLTENMAGGVDINYGTSIDSLEYVMGSDD